MSREPIGAVKNRGHALLERVDGDLVAGRISEEKWYRESAAVIILVYLVPIIIVHIQTTPGTTSIRRTRAA